jgi:hypothetical protein
MKKIFLTSVIFVSLTCVAQKPKLDSISNTKKDTLEMVPYKTEFISLSLIDSAYKIIQDNMTVTKYTQLSEGIDLAFKVLIDIGLRDYNRKKKPKK